MIEGFEHTGTDHKCSVCQCEFTDDEGGIQGCIGIIPVSFCPTCFAGICDMVEQLYDKEWEDLTEREMMDAIQLDDSPMQMGRKIEAKLREKNFEDQD